MSNNTSQFVLCFHHMNCSICQIIHPPGFPVTEIKKKFTQSQILVLKYQQRSQSMHMGQTEVERWGLPLPSKYLLAGTLNLSQNCQSCVADHHLHHSHLIKAKRIEQTKSINTSTLKPRNSLQKQIKSKHIEGRNKTDLCSILAHYWNWENMKIINLNRKTQQHLLE